MCHSFVKKTIRYSDQLEYFQTHIAASVLSMYIDIRVFSRPKCILEAFLADCQYIDKNVSLSITPSTGQTF